MKFRPCIDLHGGRVKQIVGATLSEAADRLHTNFASDLPASHYAELYRRDQLSGGHVIMLGPGNEKAAASALAAYPGGLQLGGGITAANAGAWLDRGAAAVIVTSYVFRDGRIYEDRLRELVSAVGRERLVLDLSCRRRGDDYFIVTDRWQRFTEVNISSESLDYFAKFCSEFLIHGVDVEGRCAGIDGELVTQLGRTTPLPTTYAGGVQQLADLYRIKKMGCNRLDATVGSALDIFGGNGMTYTEAVAFNRAEEKMSRRPAQSGEASP
ncbi:MAG: phosphoribosylformimino-5-aminoimidazole carboxamide ribotide isomerase [Deltaproteobacteria bacterium]|jgi:phosphoribosylformimino-5-aminoimidazole carboxamide ribotide isomerase